MKYCSECGSTVELRIPADDNLHRHVCSTCGTIHYQNPKVVAGCIPEWEDRILLCRRAIEPRKGLWTLPAGFMENGETVEQAAARETYEEAQAQVDIVGLYALYNITHVNQIYLMFRGILSRPEFAPGFESLDVALFKQDEIPWDQLAFKVIHATLTRYYHDQPSGNYPIFVDEIRR
jgi:ADP-ribose pyrophosphatase YjhB (NUDIX family)